MDEIFKVWILDYTRLISVEEKMEKLDWWCKWSAHISCKAEHTVTFCLKLAQISCPTKSCLNMTGEAAERRNGVVGLERNGRTAERNARTAVTRGEAPLGCSQRENKQRWGGWEQRQRHTEPATKHHVQGNLTPAVALFTSI